MSRYQSYPSYKDSGVEWLGEVPEHWKVFPIKRLSPVQRGASPRPIDNPKYFDDEGEYAWVRIADVSASNGLLTETIQQLSDLGSSLSVKIQPGSLFVSIAGSVGKPCIAGLKACIHDGFVYFPLLKIDPKYLYRIFEAGTCYLGLGKMGTQLNLNTETVGGIYIALPPEDELKNILSFLDIQTAKIDTLIAKQERMVELLNEKRSALISHVVTKGLDPDVPMKDSGIEWLGEVPENWNFDKFRYIFNFSKGLTITKADLMETGIPCVNYGEIHSKYGFEVSAERHALKCVDHSYIETDKSSLMSNGDFVFADTSEDLEGAGNFTHVSGDTNIFAGYHTIIARQTKNNNARFLAYLIDSKVFRTQIRLAVKGVKVFSITQAILRDSSVWLPNITEQTAIANFLDDKTAKIDTLIAKARQAIELMKERRTALISAAVTGKIDVRGIA